MKKTFCFRCYAEMVKVTIINTWGIEKSALVCTECGRIYSKDYIFKKAR